MGGGVEIGGKTKQVFGIGEGGSRLLFRDWDLAMGAPGAVTAIREYGARQNVPAGTLGAAVFAFRQFAIILL